MSFSEIYNNIVEKLIASELTAMKAEMFKGFENYSVLNDYISMPSKHIRSVLSFLFLKASGYKITSEQLKLQSAVELIHNASLLHDDVIDESKMRRNKPSFNKKEGNHMAVIAGDFILSFALNKLVELNSVELIRMFSKALNKMCIGEIKQNALLFKIPTLDEYIEKTCNKTGSLFEAAINGALFIAGAGNGNSFAKNFGIAFQIRDDIINITQKSSDSDIENGIYNAPVIFSSNPGDPMAGIEKAKGLLNNYIEKAKSDLEILPENKYKNALIIITELLSNE